MVGDNNNKTRQKEESPLFFIWAQNVIWPAVITTKDLMKACVQLFPALHSTFTQLSSTSKPTVFENLVSAVFFAYFLSNPVWSIYTLGENTHIRQFCEVTV